MNLDKALTDYAIQHSGTDADIDPDLEAAATDHLLQQNSEHARGEIVTIDIDVENGSMSATNVWTEEAGRFREDPTFDEFVTETQSDRHNLDSE